MGGEAVLIQHGGDEGPRVNAAGHRDRLVEVFPPARNTEQYRQLPRMRNAIANGDPIGPRAPLVGSPSARSITRCTNRSPSSAWPANHMHCSRATSTSTADRRTTRAADCSPTQAAPLPGSGYEIPASSSGHPCPSPATPCRPRAAEVIQFVKAGVGDAAGARTVFMHSRVRGAMRIDARPRHRWATGRHRSGSFPADPRGPDIAGLRPASCAHVPAESGAQVIGGLEMLGDQRRVLIQRIR